LAVQAQNWSFGRFRGTTWRFVAEPSVIDGECAAIAQDHGSLDHVLQFTNIAGPLVRTEQIESFLVYVCDLLPQSCRVAVDEILDK
jgi:hypothetical protein